MTVHQIYPPTSKYERLHDIRKISPHAVLKWQNDFFAGMYTRKMCTENHLNRYEFFFYVTFMRQKNRKEKPK